MVHVDELNCPARMAPECVASESLCFSGGCLLELAVFSGGKKKKAEALFALKLLHSEELHKCVDSPELFSSAVAQLVPFASPLATVGSQSSGSSLKGAPISVFATLQFCFPY